MEIESRGYEPPKQEQSINPFSSVVGQLREMDEEKFATRISRASSVHGVELDNQINLQGEGPEAFVWLVKNRGDGPETIPRVMNLLNQLADIPAENKDAAKEICKQIANLVR